MIRSSRQESQLLNYTQQGNGNVHCFTPLAEVNNCFLVQPIKKGKAASLQVVWLTFAVPSSSQPYVLSDPEEEAVHLHWPAAVKRCSSLHLKHLVFPAAAAMSLLSLAQLAACPIASLCLTLPLLARSPRLPLLLMCLGLDHPPLKYHLGKCLRKHLVNLHRFFFTWDILPSEIRWPQSCWPFIRP